MRKRRLGRTGLTVSELALGTWGLSGDGYGAVPAVEQVAVLERARAIGVTLVETADSYAGGQFEALLGQAFGSDPAILIVTKLGTDTSAKPPCKRFDPAYLAEALARSSERLRRTPDVVLLHNPSPVALARRRATEWLEAQRAAGVVRHWGVSAGCAESAREAIEAGAEVLSISANVFHRAVLREVSPLVRERDVGLLVHSVLAFGLLAGLWGPSHTFGPRDHRAERWTAEELRTRVQQLDALRPVVRGNVHSLRAAALRWALESEPVGAVVLGPRSRVQLDQLVREAGGGPPYLPPDQLDALDARLAELGVL